MELATVLHKADRSGQVSSLTDISPNVPLPYTYFTTWIKDEQKTFRNQLIILKIGALPSCTCVAATLEYMKIGHSNLHFIRRDWRKVFHLLLFFK